jgi:hypothetical protein
MEVNTMSDPIVRFPVKCPCCGQESLAREGLEVIMNRFSDDRPIKLHADCEYHRLVWVASEIERNQIQDYATVVHLYVISRSHAIRRFVRWLTLPVRVQGSASNDPS